MCYSHKMEYYLAIKRNKPLVDAKQGWISTFSWAKEAKHKRISYEQAKLPYRNRNQKSGCQSGVGVGTAGKDTVERETREPSRLMTMLYSFGNNGTTNITFHIIGNHFWVGLVTYVTLVNTHPITYLRPVQLISCNYISIKTTNK